MTAVQELVESCGGTVPEDALALLEPGPMPECQRVQSIIDRALTGESWALIAYATLYMGWVE